LAIIDSGRYYTSITQKPEDLLGKRERKIEEAKKKNLKRASFLSIILR